MEKTEDVMSITDIRAGIATNLGTISGLRVASEIPDNPSPPIAIVQLRSIDYDSSFGKGLAIYTFAVSVIVARVAERTAQRRLNDYADNDGASSVKTAIESDKTLGGAAFDCRVSTLDNIGVIQLGDADYMAADFSVIAYAK